MFQDLKEHNPIFKFEIASKEDEIELVTEIIYDAIVNHSQFNYMLYQKYPKLIDLVNENMNEQQVIEAVGIAVTESYDTNIHEIIKKIKLFKHRWEKVQNELLRNLSNDMESSFQANSIITVKVGNAPLCPRWIEKLSFYVPSYISNFNLIALHECCHFLFFNKYKLIFGKCDETEYNYPSNLWLLSEILIDVLLNKSFFVTIIGEEIRAYDYLYDIFVEDKNLVECIKEIVNENERPEEYIEKSIQFIKKNSKKIY